jgi:dienelactone hydrolase
MLPVRIFRPPGPGPFPLAIVNHGSPGGGKRGEVRLPVFRTLSDWLLARGYVVALPLRRGYGSVGGGWDEGFGRCNSPDYDKAGLETARDIEAVLAILSEQAYVQKGSAIIIGQSAGGWGTLALASRNPPGVLGHVNFAGGRGGRQGNQPNRNCTPAELVRAAARFGATARQPTLWLYAENDSFFAPALAQQMHHAFVRAGGRAAFHLFPAVGDDGHGLVSLREGVEHWAPVLEKFLRDLR